MELLLPSFWAWHFDVCNKIQCIFNHLIIIFLVFELDVVTYIWHPILRLKWSHRGWRVKKQFCSKFLMLFACIISWWLCIAALFYFKNRKIIWSQCSMKWTSLVTVPGSTLKYEPRFPYHSKLFPCTSYYRGILLVMSIIQIHYSS